jgi:hypothetical protein
LFWGGRLSLELTDWYVVYHDADIDHAAAKQLGVPVTKFLGHPVERVVGTASLALHW